MQSPIPRNAPRLTTITGPQISPRKPTRAPECPARTPAVGDVLRSKAIPPFPPRDQLRPPFRGGSFLRASPPLLIGAPLPTILMTRRDQPAKEGYHIRDTVGATLSVLPEDVQGQQGRAHQSTTGSFPPSAEKIIRDTSRQMNQTSRNSHEISTIPKRQPGGDECAVRSVITSGAREAPQKSAAATQTSIMHSQAYANWRANGIDYRKT